jgi:hypothetical protein
MFLMIGGPTNAFSRNSPVASSLMQMRAGEGVHRANRALECAEQHVIELEGSRAIPSAISSDRLASQTTAGCRDSCAAQLRVARSTVARRVTDVRTGFCTIANADQLVRPAERRRTTTRRPTMTTISVSGMAVLIRRIASSPASDPGVEPMSARRTGHRSPAVVAAATEVTATTRYPARCRGRPTAYATAPRRRRREESKPDLSSWVAPGAGFADPDVRAAGKSRAEAGARRAQPECAVI